MSNQLWFFVFEDVKSLDFRQAESSLQKVEQEGISLVSVLQQLRLEGDALDYSFFIHSSSMHASVQVLNDAAIHGTWQLYCTQDAVITITVRKAKDPSPNSSRAPSYGQSLSKRRAASGNRFVPDIPLPQAPDEIISHFDAALQSPASDLAEDEKVVLVRDDGSAEAFSLEYVRSRYCNSVHHCSY